MGSDLCLLGKLLKELLAPFIGFLDVLKKNSDLLNVR